MNTYELMGRAVMTYARGLITEDELNEDLTRFIERKLAVKPHYHVFAGTVGCLADGNATFENKRDAERYMLTEANDYRDAGIKVSGNVKTGYSIDPINYLEVVTCNDPNCELWAEYQDATA